VIFNFRGTGESGGSLELGFWPDDLIAVLDCLDAHESLCSSKYAVLGFSAGGAAAIFAGARDDRIDTLVAAAVPADFDFLGLAGREQQYFDYYRGLGMIRPDYPGDAKAWAHNFNMLQSKNAMGDVRAKNVCLMHGGKDDTVPFAHMETLAALCPTNVRQIALPNSGHQLRCESVAVRAMLDYLMKTAKKAES
jgi:pimeloyl-ACP methyl ester carboxylesterase